MSEIFNRHEAAVFQIPKWSQHIDNNKSNHNNAQHSNQEQDNVVSLEDEELMMSSLRQAYLFHLEGRSSWFTLNWLLNQWLDILRCEYGYIASIDDPNDSANKLHLHCKQDYSHMTLNMLAVTNIAWTPELDKFVIPNKLSFKCSQKALYLIAMKYERSSFTNNPDDHEEAKGRPEGHPPLRSFAAINILINNVLYGQLALANRTNGFTEPMMAKLETICTSLATLLLFYSKLPPILSVKKIQSTAQNEASATNNHSSPPLQTSQSIPPNHPPVTKSGIHFCPYLAKSDSSSTENSEKLDIKGDQERSNEEITENNSAHTNQIALDKEPSAIMQEKSLSVPSVAVEATAGGDNNVKSNVINIDSAQEFRGHRLQSFAALDRLIPEEINHVVMETINQGVIVVDQTGSIQLMNPGSIRLLKLNTNQNMVGNTILNILPELKQFFQDVCADKNQFRGLAMECKALCADKSNLDVQVTVSSLLFNAAILYAVIVQDISEQKRHEQEKDQFISFTSHEIRNPLHAIIATLDSFDEEVMKSIPNQLKEGLSTITECAMSMKTLINDVLDLSKLNANRMEFENIPFSISEVVNSIVRAQKSAARSKGLLLNCSIANNIPVSAFGDAYRLQQVLNNLINNAVKFTTTGFVTVTVALEENDSLYQSVGASEAEQTVQSSYSFSNNPASTCSTVTCNNDQNTKLYRIIFTIQDTGCGIDSHLLPQLFQSFRQSAPYIARVFGGSGLGLAIVAQLVKQMNGTIKVESSVNRGSTFSVHLTYNDAKNQPNTRDNTTTNNNNSSCNHASMNCSEAKSEAGREEVSHVPFTDVDIIHQSMRQVLSKCEESHLPAAAAAAAADPPNVNTLILIADDSVINLKLICRMLQDYSCVTAKDGEEVVQAVKSLYLNGFTDSSRGRMTGRKQFDIIISDILMPVKNGLTAATEIRQFEVENNLTHIPLIAITGNAMKTDRLACIHAGFDFIISKPFHKQELFGVLNNLNNAQAQSS
jgi:signal transduction histidine kinase